MLMLMLIPILFSSGFRPSRPVPWSSLNTRRAPETVLRHASGLGIVDVRRRCSVQPLPSR